MCSSSCSIGNLLSHLEQLIQCLDSMWPSSPLLLKIFLQIGQLSFTVALGPDPTLASASLITFANLRRDLAKAFTLSGPVLTGLGFFSSTSAAMFSPLNFASAVIWMTCTGC